MSWGPRLLAIFLGIVLGVGVVAAFVFTGGEHSIDAPLLSTSEGNGHPGGREKAPTPVGHVQIVGGAPPTSGPAQLHYRRGDPVRLQVSSDETLTLEVTGYGIEHTVDAGKPTTIEFQATKTGNFALIVAASHIAVAQLTVD